MSQTHTECLTDLSKFKNDVRILTEHIVTLKAHISLYRSGLEEIKDIADLGASGRDCGECAEVLLEKLPVIEEESQTQKEKNPYHNMDSYNLGYKAGYKDCVDNLDKLTDDINDGLESLEKLDKDLIQTYDLVQVICILRHARDYLNLLSL